ncbi:hypothetical protein GA0074695_4709 [Micromonospora viridifaciens]|uniref:DUF6493 domain-containing protein n=1 Tax=Micromonospora viridifaciens TaxID=1881 RepID=A0A1C4YUU0_MICVI|nr:DUF6493 family protein [Micromonospora viridifaciens]SCF24407.1 hypothetical protein GA0074695_4709 [Micromonospora viridifaciens]
MSDVWHEVCERIDDADFDVLAEALAGLDAEDRAALLPLLEGYIPAPATPEPVVLPPLEPEPEPELPTTGGFAFFYSPADGEPPKDLEGIRAYLARQRLRQREQERTSRRWHLERQAAEAARRKTDLRRAGLALAILACTPTATDAVKRLHRPWSAGPPLRVLPELVPGLLRVRGTAWCTTLARGMARRARGRATPWPFTEALMRAVGAGPPDTPGAVARYVANRRGGPLADILADDPWFDHVLPYLFDDDRVAAAFTDSSAWPTAVVELVERGRVERAVVIAGCLRRLRSGGRQRLLQPYLGMLKQVTPTTDELAGHRQELVGLLTAPMSTVADFAYTSLRALHQRSPLDPATLTEITQSMLSRPEKKLVRAHLAWLRSVPLDDVVDGLVIGLHHAVPELAERTLDLIEPRLPGLPEAFRDRLRSELPALEGVVAERLAAQLGMTYSAPAFAPVLSTDPPAELPPPLDLGALAGELATVLRMGDDDPVRHEQILDGLVRAARVDRAAAARVLEPVMPQWPGRWQALITATIGRPASYQISGTPLELFVERRCAELAVRLADDPPPALLATPATVAGHVDPDRVLSLLQQAERDGWQPGDADLTQALLRLPRVVDAAVHAAARRLVSPAGRRLADWLVGGAEPRTWVKDAQGSHHFSGGRIAMLDPVELPAELADPRTAAERANTGWRMPTLALWPMVTPSHREVAAAHIQPYVAATVDRGNPGTGFLAGLAAADGPVGPAMSLTLAYALASHRENVRLAAGDALVTLAQRPDWDSGVGAEIGTLACANQIVLQRIVRPLTEAIKAGAHDAVWQVTSAALPALLAAGQRPGLADVVTLAGNAARAGRHTTDLPGLAALAARPGRSRLAEAARRLVTIMSGRA